MGDGRSAGTVRTNDGVAGVAAVESRDRRTTRASVAGGRRSLEDIVNAARRSREEAMIVATRRRSREESYRRRLTADCRHCQCRNSTSASSPTDHQKGASPHFPPLELAPLRHNNIDPTFFWRNFCGTRSSVHLPTENVVIPWPMISSASSSQLSVR